MRRPEEPRFTPQHRSTAHAGSTTAAPRWFLREAVNIFGLKLSDIVVFYAICDNLDSDGVSRTANKLIEDRTGMALSTVKLAVSRLVEHGLIIELNERRSGSAMRYAIPRNRPLTHREIGI